MVRRKRIQNPFWALILLAFQRNNFGWSGSDGSIGFVSAQLGQAIAGNANAPQNIATQLNCNIGQVQAGIAGIQSAIQSVGAQNNLSFAQTVNAIQAGNTAIANLLKISHPAVSLIYMALQLAVSFGFVWVCGALAQYLGVSLILVHWVYLVVALAVLAVAYVLFMKKNYWRHEEYLRRVGR